MYQIRFTAYLGIVKVSFVFKSIPKTGSTPNIKLCVTTLNMYIKHELLNFRYHWKIGLWGQVVGTLQVCGKDIVWKQFYIPGIYAEVALFKEYFQEFYMTVNDFIYS